MQEIYKKIDWFEFIEVSNLWNVKGKEWCFAITEAKWSRPYFMLRAQEKILGKLLYKPVHILVADLFLWRKEEIERRKIAKEHAMVIVCHLDDNPQNNTTDNLYLWTPKSNAEDCKRNKLIKINSYGINVQ